MSTESSPLPAPSNPASTSSWTTSTVTDVDADAEARRSASADRTQVSGQSAGPDASSSGAAAGAPMAGRREAARRQAQGSARSGPDRPTEGVKPRRPPARRTRKVRRVHRVVRHIEVWSVAKLAAIYVACGYVVAMVSGYLLWRAADRVGTIDGIEGFMEDSGAYQDFQILGDVVFRASAIIGVVLAVLTVFMIVLGAVLFNLISDLTGGIRMTVIDEDLIVAPARRPPAVSPPSPGSARPDGPPADADRHP